MGQAGTGSSASYDTGVAKKFPEKRWGPPKRLPLAPWPIPDLRAVRGVPRPEPVSGRRPESSHTARYDALDPPWLQTTPPGWTHDLTESSPEIRTSETTEPCAPYAGPSHRMWDNYSDLGLLQSAGENLEAFGELIRRHQDFVFEATMRVVRNRPIAEELTHEALLRGFRARDGFRGDAWVRSWLYRIATNLAKNEVSRRRKWPTDQDLDSADHTDPGQRSDSEALTIDVRGRNRATPRKPAGTARLREYEELSCAEISERTGVPLNTVRTRKHSPATSTRASERTSHEPERCSLHRRRRAGRTAADLDRLKDPSQTTTDKVADLIDQVLPVLCAAVVVVTALIIIDPDRASNRLYSTRRYAEGPCCAHRRDHCPGS